MLARQEPFNYHPFMRIARFTTIILLLGAGSGCHTELAAQAPWPSTVGCTLAADTNSLQVTLPLPVLDHLESISNSPFAHAYLVRYIGSEAAGQHRVSRCARDFTQAELRDIPTMRSRLPDAAEIIQALRDAAETRRRLQELGSSQAADDAHELLRQELSLPALNTYLPRLEADESKHCQRISAGACGVLTNLVPLGSALRQAHGSAASLEGQLRLTRSGPGSMAARTFFSFRFLYFARSW